MELGSVAGQQLLNTGLQSTVKETEDNQKTINTDAMGIWA